MERAFKGIWIPKEIWLNENLTLLEKVFLVEIDSLDNEEGCYASNDYFSNFFKLSKNRCSEVIKSLEKKGLVKLYYKYKPNTKLIEKRIIKVLENPNIGIRYSEEGIRNLDRGYSENCEDNNTVFNNTLNNNSSSSSKTSLEDAIAYYRREIVNRHVLTKLEQDFFLEIGNKVSYGLVIKAMEISIESNVRELRYIKGIIKKWIDADIKTLERLNAYELKKKSKKEVKPNGSSTKRTKQFEQQIPVDDEKDEEYYRLLKECERLSRE